MSHNKVMITLITKIFNNITQDLYNKIIDNLDLHTVCCSSCKHNNLIFYGVYTRHFKQGSVDIVLNIVRVRCKDCHHTHALLLDCMVPYSQFPLIDQVNIINNQDNQKVIDDIMTANNCIDEYTVAMIKKRYNKFFKECLISYGILLEIDTISENCLIKLKRQFMQIKTTINWLYRANNITYLQTSMILN